MNVRSTVWKLLLGAALALVGVACDDADSRPVDGVDSGDIDMMPGGDAGPEADMGPMADMAPPLDMGGDLDAGPVEDAMVGDDVGPDDDLGVDGGEADMGPVEPNPCAPCEADEDCAPEGARCLEFDDGMFCGAPCEDDMDCAEDSVCGAFDDGDPQCIPIRGSCMACDDGDLDGYGVGPGCLGLDCDDGDPNVNPGVADPCDGVDNDCDDATDEDFAPQACGVGACAAESACVDGVPQDCQAGEPAAQDFTCDGVDDDCDGNVDEDYAPESCGIGPCEGRSACVDGVEQACAPLPPPAQDDATCDMQDQDCDGSFDEDFVGAPCGQGACAMTGVCVDGAVMCEPGDPLAADDATCNGVDEDCDGQVDEDHTVARTCGLGACQRTFQCVDADLACTPGDPLAADDRTCDEIDDDCDGFVDEDCQQNFLGFALNQAGADFIDVDITYEQIHSPANEGTQWLPRLIELNVFAPHALVLRTPSDQAIIPGQPVIDAQKNISLLGRDAEGIRILVFSQANTNRIGPGTLMTLRFTHEPGLTGPFAFSFNEELSSFAPMEADAVLQHRAAELGGE